MCLESNVGRRVRLKAKKGRKKSVVKHGIIESTYPSIFVIKLDDENQIVRRVSYSYTDVLTKTVELAVCKEESREIKCS